MKQSSLQPTTEDYLELFQKNQLAQEQLKTIVLSRLLAEAEEALAEKAKESPNGKAEETQEAKKVA